MNNIHCFLCEQNIVLPIFVIFLLIVCARVGYSTEVNFQPYCNLSQYNVPTSFLESSYSYKCGGVNVDTYTCYPGTSQCLERVCHTISEWDRLWRHSSFTSTDFDVINSLKEGVFSLSNILLITRDELVASND